MALVRMKPPVGVSVGLGADDKLYYIDGQGFANVDSGSVTKLTAEGWVSAVPVAPEAPGNTFPISATKTLTGGIELTQSGSSILVIGSDGTVIDPNEVIADQVTLSATGFVAATGGLLHRASVLSGSALTVAIKDSAGVTGGRAIATYAGMQAGDVLEFGGIAFTNGLHMTLTGTGTIKFEVTA